MATSREIFYTTIDVARRVRAAADPWLATGIVCLAAALLALRGLPLRDNLGFLGHLLAYVWITAVILAATFVPRRLGWQWQSIGWSLMLVCASLNAMAFFFMGWDSLIAESHPAVAQLALIVGIEPRYLRWLIITLMSFFTLLTCWIGETKNSWVRPARARAQLPKSGASHDINAAASHAHPTSRVTAKTSLSAEPRHKPRHSPVDRTERVESATNRGTSAEYIEQTNGEDDFPIWSTQAAIQPRKHGSVALGVVFALALVAAASASGDARMTKDQRLDAASSNACELRSDQSASSDAAPIAGVVRKVGKEIVPSGAPPDSNGSLDPKKRRDQKRDRPHERDR